jgi:riboflavin synthase
MFTGLISEVGRILGRRPRPGGGAVLRVEHGYGPLDEGESVAVDGVCLTVAEQGGGWFESDLSAETVERTGLGRAEAGRRVNLERSLAVGDRLGGHWVQGHVEGEGELVERHPSGDGWMLGLSAPTSLVPYLVEKGSVAVDGVSLTVTGLEGRVFRVAVVPHTWRRTNLADRRVGDRVHLESDLVVRTVVGTLERWSRKGEGGLTLERALRESGYLGAGPREPKKR